MAATGQPLILFDHVKGTVHTFGADPTRDSRLLAELIEAQRRQQATASAQAELRK